MRWPGHAGVSGNNVQVCRLCQTHGINLAVNVLHGETLLGVDPPAAQHDVVHRLRAQRGPAEQPAVPDVINHL